MSKEIPECPMLGPFIRARPHILTYFNGDRARFPTKRAVTPQIPERCVQILICPI